jgi:hypothetical protein
MSPERWTLCAAAGCVLGLVISVVSGRVATMHCTVSEALIQGWPYWVCAIIFAGWFTLLTRSIEK